MVRVDCAHNAYTVCHEPLNSTLSKTTELDAYMGCFVEDGPEACENEIDERKYLADALLMQGESLMEEQQLSPFDQGGFYNEGSQGHFIDEGIYAPYEQPMQNNFGPPTPPVSRPPTHRTLGPVRNAGDAGVSDFLPRDFSMAPDSFRGSQSHVTTKESHNGKF